MESGFLVASWNYIHWGRSKLCSQRQACSLGPWGKPDAGAILEPSFVEASLKGPGAKIHRAHLAIRQASRLCLHASDWCHRLLLLELEYEVKLDSHFTVFSPRESTSSERISLLGGEVVCIERTLLPIFFNVFFFLISWLSLGALISNHEFGTFMRYFYAWMVYIGISMKRRGLRLPILVPCWYPSQVWLKYWDKFFQYIQCILEYLYDIVSRWFALTVLLLIHPSKLLVRL